MLVRAVSDDKGSRSSARGRVRIPLRSQRQGFIGEDLFEQKTVRGTIPRRWV